MYIITPIAYRSTGLPTNELRRRKRHQRQAGPYPILWSISGAMYVRLPTTSCNTPSGGSSVAIPKSISFNTFDPSFSNNKFSGCELRNEKEAMERRTFRSRWTTFRECTYSTVVTICFTSSDASLLAISS